MESFDIVLCDDEEYYINDLKTHILKYQKEANTQFRFREYRSGEQLIEDITKESIPMDIIFLDIKMMDLDGVEVAKIIRQTHKDVVIAFITNYEEYALHAFEVEAMDYLLKPIAYDKVKRFLERGMVHIRYCMDREQSNMRYLSIKHKGEDVLVDTNTVIYIEKMKNQCIFHMERSTLTCYESIAKLKDKLDESQFVFSHQGYIINFHKVKEVKKNAICLGNGIEVPVSRKHYITLRNRHLDKIERLRIGREQGKSTYDS